MEMISGIAVTIYQWITTHPFDTLFIGIDLLFLYCFAAGLGFLMSSDHTIKGPERALPGRALNRIDTSVHFDEREREGTRLLLIGLVCLLALLFVPIRFSFWIKLLIIIASAVVSLLLTAVWGVRYKQNQHSDVYFNRIKSARQQKQAGLMAERRQEALRYLRAGFDSEEDFLRAVQIYGQERLLKSIDNEINGVAFEYSQLGSIDANLRGEFKAHQHRIATLDELVPGGAAAHTRILQRLSDTDRDRAEYLLGEILDPYVDFRRKDEYREEFKALMG